MLVDKRNGKKYVGKHNGNKKNYWSSGLVPNRIAKKHGKDIFDKIILEDNINNEELNEKEIFHIKNEDSFLNGYNSTAGGDGGGHWIYLKTEDEIKRIAEIKSKKLTGRVFSEETKAKMSESAKNKVFTDEHKKNIGKAVKQRGGKKHSEETKEKLSKNKKGIPNKQHSEFMQINNPNFQKVLVDGVYYNSIKEVCDKYGLCRSSVKYRLNSKSDKFKNWCKINR